MIVNYEWDPLFDRLEELYFNYDLTNFSEQESEEFYKRYKQTDLYFYPYKDLNAFGKLIFRMILTNNIHDKDTDFMERWDWFINTDLYYIDYMNSDEMIMETIEEASKRIAGFYLFTLYINNKKLSIIKKIKKRIYMYLIHKFIGNDMYKPKSYIGILMIKNKKIYNYIHMYERKI